MDSLVLNLAVTGADSLPDVAPPPPPPPWTPDLLASLRGWWVPHSLGATVGASISSLPSSGGLTNTLTQASSSLQPTYQLFESTGKGALQFDGSDDSMAIGDNTISDAAPALVMWALLKLSSIPTDSSTRDLISMRVASGSTRRMLLGLGNQTSNKNWAVQYKSTDGATNTAINATVPATTDACLIMAQINFASPKIDMWLNATSIHSSTPGFTPGNLSSGPSTASYVGGDQAAPGVKMPALIAQCGVHRGTLTTEERQKLEGYAMWYGGIQSLLPSDHPYKSAAPTI